MVLPLKWRKCAECERVAHLGALGGKRWNDAPRQWRLNPELLFVAVARRAVQRRYVDPTYAEAGLLFLLL